MCVDDLELQAIRATLRHLGAKNGLTWRPVASGEGVRAVLASEEGGDDAFFVLAPRGSAWVSVSLVLVVDESFFRENVESILGVTSQYEVCTSLGRDDSIEPGEGYLNLSLRLFRSGLTDEMFRLSLANLRAARDALARSFP